MDTLSPSARHALRTDLRLVEQGIQSGVVSGRASTSRTHWTCWSSYCHSVGLHPLLPNCADPIQVLAVFAIRYQSGLIAPSGRPVRSGTVDEALRSVGQAFSCMGARDIRFDSLGRIDLRLTRLLSSFARLEDPPHRVKPLPIPVLQALLSAAYSPTGSPLHQAIADMACIAYFYLCRPGEYSAVNEDSTPFRLCDVQFHAEDSVVLAAQSADLSAIACARGTSLTFTNQKNGVRGEVIALGRSGHALCCATTALQRRVAHLRANGAPASSPLAMVYRPNLPPVHLRSRHITQALRTTLLLMPSPLGIAPSDISSRSLRAGGAQALLCAKVDSDEIKLLGRWRSDTMLRYLSAQALPIMEQFAQHILTGGNFTVVPNLAVPMF